MPRRIAVESFLTVTPSRWTSDGSAEDDGDDRDDDREDRSIDEELGHASPSIRRGGIGVRTRRHARSGPHFLETVDDDPVARLHALLDDPALADAVAGHDASRLHD